MALFDAQPVDPQHERRKRIIIVAVLVVALLAAGLTWYFWNWRYEQRVDQFFSALQARDLERAYALWFNDPDWKQHPQKYSDYSFGRFELDWGPGGEWGHIREYRIVGSRRTGTGVIVVVEVNRRAQHARLWVERSDMTITWSPR